MSAKCNVSVIYVSLYSRSFVNKLNSFILFVYVSFFLNLCMFSTSLFTMAQFYNMQNLESSNSTMNGTLDVLSQQQIQICVFSCASLGLNTCIPKLDTRHSDSDIKT